MIDFFQILLSGVALGGVYAMVGLGLGMIYNTSGIIHFAHGELVMLGALIYAVASMQFHDTLALLFATVGVGGVGYVLYLFFLKPIQAKPILEKIIMTIALSLVLKGLAMWIWGKSIHPASPFLGEFFFDFFHVQVHSQQLWVLGTVFLLAGLLWYFFNHTLAGKALRAISENIRGAKLTGLPVDQLIGISFFSSAFIGGLAGALYAPLSLPDYHLGSSIAIKGFAVLILGGLGHYYGTFFAGLLLGILEAMISGYFHSGYKDMMALLVLFLVLVIRPQGIFHWKRG